MSKDPFQILADELTLIRKDMDQLQRTSLNKDEAKKLNQIVTAAVMKMAKATDDAPGEIQGALEADRDQMARSATQAATRAAESAMAGIRHDLDNERAKLSQAAGEARREAWRWFVLSDNHLGRCRQPPWPVGLDGRRACPSGGQPHRPD